MRLLLPLALLALPATAQAAVHPRTSPEWSDLALAVVAVVAVWFVRRALRARFRANPPIAD